MTARSLALLALLAEISLSTTALAEDRQPSSPWSPMEYSGQGVMAPPVVPLRRIRRPAVWVSGLLFLTVPYSFSLNGAIGSAALKGPDRYGWLALPGAGPLVLMAETTNAGGNVVLAFDAMSQAAGIALITYDLLHPRWAYVEDDQLAAPRMTLTPIFAAGRVGVGVTGSF
jgi:hypothetical protein